MTALAGLWRFASGGDPAGACARMLQAQQVYAPDAPASWSGERIAIGRRLFRTLPEDRFDRGPVAGGSGALVADVRLDNRGELCAALGIGTSDAASLADAAILMKALERWDLGAVERLEGDFAFAWWDAARGRLVLARDFIGQRPLHYHRGDGFFAFASMPKGLHALPKIPVAPDRRAVAEFLALMPESGTETFFEGIEKVATGNVAVVTPGGVEMRRYWDPSPVELRLPRSADYREALREQLDRAVAVRLRGAGGQVGSHLSGGLDSAAVAATAARLLAGEGGSVAGFTAVPREGWSGPAPRETIADEGPLAAEVAALHPNIEHVLVRSGARSPLEGLGRGFFLYERPVLNLCNAVWYDAILDEAKRRRLPVMLSGALGNASFSYDGMAELSRLARRGRLLRLGREAALLVRRGTRAGTVAAQAIGPFLPTRLWNAIGRLRGSRLSLADYSALDPARAEELRLAERAAERGLDLSYRPRADPVEARLWMLRRVDSGNHKKGVLGGWGIDVRDPAADRRLVEFCLSVPAAQFLSRGVPRALARSALADRLPPAILAERRRGYQAADWHEGLAAARGEVAEEIAAIADCPAAAEALDTATMARLLEHWPEDGSWTRPAVVRRYRMALLRGVSAGRFIRQALGANR